MYGRVMTLGPLVSLAGAVLQVVGATVALTGLLRTYDQFADQPLLIVARERAAKVIRRLLRRPPPPIELSGTAEMHLSMKAELTTGWAALSGDPVADVNLLRERTEHLRSAFEDERKRMDEKLVALEATLEATRGQISEVDVRLGARIRAAAIGGFRLQAVGLFLVILGLAVQGIGLLIG
jgi:hypothetical protein